MIRINRVRVRLPASRRGSARKIVQQAVQDAARLAQPKRDARVHQLSPPRVRISQGMSDANVAKRIGESISTSIDQAST